MQGCCFRHAVDVWRTPSYGPEEALRDICRGLALAPYLQGLGYGRLLGSSESVRGSRRNEEEASTIGDDR